MKDNVPPCPAADSGGNCNGMASADLVAEKRAIRKKMREARAQLAPDRLLALGNLACERMRKLAIWQRAGSVALYVALPAELSTLPLLNDLWAAGRTVWLPRIVGQASGGQMEFVDCPGPDCLRPGSFGLQEPHENLPGHKPEELMGGDAPALFIVPGLAFDRTGGRLGHGGGFYDRWIAAARQCAQKLAGKAGTARPGTGKTCFAGLCLSCQLLRELPLAPWDCRMDLVCTEEEVIWP